ncbi:MAG TPA: phage tail tape measure protein [Kofleriaceae bacterium]
MALNQMGLGFVFTAKNEVTAVVERINQSFGDLEQRTEHLTHASKASFADFGKGMAVFAAGTAVIGGAFGLAEQGDQFLAMLDQAGALANASAQEMERLRAAALDVALKGTGTSAAEAAEALRELVQEGYNADDAIKALGPTLTLVALGFGQISRAQAAGLVNDTLGEFRLGAEAAAPLVDKLALLMRVFGIRATELEPALRGVATGASLTGASLDDTLIALGLTKSVLPSVEQAARSVNLAFNQLASDHTRKELAAIGVQVTDSSGKMRPLIEILSDLNKRTAKMSESQREHALASIFSARAGGGLTAIMQALSDGIRDTSGHVLTGTAAIDELRKQMAGATGTAAQMKTRLLDDFKGEKKALIGSTQTFLELLGEPFQQVFTGILSVLRRAFVAVNQFIAGIPTPVKIFLAKVVLVVGSVVALIGAVIAAKAAIALVLVGLKILGVTLAGIVATLLPAIALFAVLALVVAGFAVAFRHNIGGIGTFFETLAARIKLLFQGLAQLFHEGGFSGAVMTELAKAENSGVKQFAIRVYQIVYRLRRFFEGVADGFRAGIQAARPVFDAFVGALRELGEAFGVIGTQSADALAAIGSDRYASAGASLGQTLARIATVIVDALTVVIRVAAGFINGIREAFAYFRPVFDLVGKAIGFVAEELRGLVSDITGVTDRAREGGSVWSGLGEVLGVVAGTAGATLAGAIGVVALALRTVIAIVRAVIHAFVWLGQILGERAAQIYLFFTETILPVLKVVAGAVRSFLQPVLDFLNSIVDGIHAALDRVVAFVGRLVAKIPARFRPAFLDSIVEAGEAAQARIAARTAKAVAPAAALGPGGAPVAAALPTGGSLPGVALGAAAAGSALPAVSELRVRGQISDAEIDAIVARGIQLSDNRPVQAHVTLSVDGETLARATARANRSTAARSFVPVPVGG